MLLLTLVKDIDDEVRNPFVVVLDKIVLKLHKFNAACPLNIHSIAGVGLPIIVTVNTMLLFSVTLICEGENGLVVSSDGLTEKNVNLSIIS